MRAGYSVLTAIYEFIFDGFGELIDLMTDSRVTSALSFNFLYALICIWIIWQAVNMFLINPLPGGSLVNESVDSAVRLKVRMRHDKAVKQARQERAERDASREAERRRTKTYTRNYYKRDKKSGEYKLSRSQKITRDYEGNTTTYEG